MNRHKYRFADLDCEYCADKKSDACLAGQCPHIMENLSDLFDDDSFCEAVENAEKYRSRHRRTLVYIKNNAIEKSHAWLAVEEIDEEAIARCDYKPECQTCRYGGIGFICYNERDGSCMRDWIQRTKNGKGAVNHGSIQS